MVPVACYIITTMQGDPELKSHPLRSSVQRISPKRTVSDKGIDQVLMLLIIKSSVHPQNGLKVERDFKLEADCESPCIDMLVPEV